MTSKVDHVKHAQQTRPHTCHWPGCTKQVSPAMWGCAAHWFKLPMSLRSRIWETYRPEQEKDMKPSAEYLKTAQDVQHWIKTKDK